MPHQIVHPYFDVMNPTHLRERAKRYGSEPYWFGLGFIQLKLSDTERMHFWTPSIPRKQREEIHDHRYNFRSIVLAGNLKFEVFSVYDDVHGAYERFETNCQPGKEGEVLNCEPVSIQRVGFYQLPVGSIYDFPMWGFHTTEETAFAITYLRREPHVKDRATVVKTRGEGTTCPFAEKVDPEICWQHIEQALKHATNEKIHSIPCRGCGAPSGKFGDIPSVIDAVCGFCSVE